MVNGNINFDGKDSDHTVLAIRMLTCCDVDYLGLNTCLFEWADSYDAKDWERLSKCIAPTLKVRKIQPDLSTSQLTIPD
jgi:Scytalone dehydratase